MWGYQPRFLFFLSHYFHFSFSLPSSLLRSSPLLLWLGSQGRFRSLAPPAGQGAPPAKRYSVNFRLNISSSNDLQELFRKWHLRPFDRRSIDKHRGTVSHQTNITKQTSIQSECTVSQGRFSQCLRSKLCTE